MEDTSQVEARAALRHLQFGSSVAEFDENLEKYFVETDVFRALIDARCDIVGGDKGTGKTALFRILSSRRRNYPELDTVEIIPAFNPDGTPIFQRLIETDPLEEASYQGVWKTYLLSLVGNYMLGLGEGVFSADMKRLDGLLRAAGLRSDDDAPATIFARLTNRLKAIKGASITATSADGAMPIFSGHLEFDTDEQRAEVGELARIDDALSLLDRIIGEWGVEIWVALDRLDEAFPAQPDIERAALRALLRTYLDLQNLRNLRLKLFIRRDLFARVTEGGFVNLSHVNARRVDIEWDDEDLYNMLMQRVRDNVELLSEIGLSDATDDELIGALFPTQVDSGSKKPTTWRWILNRIADGNGVKPPRNLIDLAAKAREAQTRRENRDRRPEGDWKPLIEADALKRGLRALSATRVEDTLIAEAGHLAPVIQQFRGGKAQHNLDSLGKIIPADTSATVKQLQAVGFLEPLGSVYKVPLLYRAGLDITQGRAYRADSDSDELADDE